MRREVVGDERRRRAVRFDRHPRQDPALYSLSRRERVGVRGLLFPPYCVTGTGARNPRISASVFAGASTIGECPEPSIISTRAPGTFAQSLA